MLNFEEVWLRAARRERYRGWNPANLVIQAKVLAVPVAGNGSASNAPVTFPGGAIVVGITAAASPVGQAATQQNRPSLEMFSFTVAEQTNNRSIVGTAPAIGSSVFGQLGNQFPAKEIELEPNNSLLYTVNNLTSSEILVTFTHHCIINAAQG